MMPVAVPTTIEFENDPLRRIVVTIENRGGKLTGYVAVLRAVNVGGTGKLPLATLAQMFEKAGFEKVKTYIASGNVAFRSVPVRGSGAIRP